jgi:hypothetical protein
MSLLSVRAGLAFSSADTSTGHPDGPGRTTLPDPSG